MASPSTSPPRRRRAFVVAGFTAVTLVASVVPAFAHATFPSIDNPTGGSANPYPAGSTQTLWMHAPNESTSEPVATTIDLEARVPVGWTAPACGAASITATGSNLTGWVCEVVTEGANQVIHWSGPQVATAEESAQYFRFSVTTPSPATPTTYGSGAVGTGAQGFRAVQLYSDTTEEIWKTPNEPGPGTNATLSRTVAAAVAASPSPSPSPDPSPSPSPSPDPTPTLIGEQAIAATVPGSAQEFSISFATTPVALAAGTSTATFHPFTGSLNAITLKDTRTAAPSWAVAGQTSDFTGLANSGRYLGWLPAVTTAGAGAVVGSLVTSALDTPAGPGLTTSKGLASAPAAHTLGTAVLDADLDLKLPTGIPGGNYSSTLTITAI